MPAASKIKLGDLEYALAPMNLKTMETHKDFLVELMGQNFNVIGHIPQFRALLKDALMRTSPDISEEVIENGVDMGNIPDIVKALFEVSGFAAKSGEPKQGKVSRN